MCVGGTDGRVANALLLAILTIRSTPYYVISKCRGESDRCSLACLLRSRVPSILATEAENEVATSDSQHLCMYLIRFIRVFEGESPSYVRVRDEVGPG